MQAATIKLFLPNGEATGIHTAEISNWTGKAIAENGKRVKTGQPMDLRKWKFEVGLIHQASVACAREKRA